MPWNLLLLPLLGGYYFIHQFRLTRFRAKRSENQRLLIESAVAGAGWLLATRLLVLIGCHWFPILIATAREVLAQLAPFPFAPTFVGATLLEIAGAHVLNLFVPAEMAVRYAIRWYGDELQNLLFDSMRAPDLISITLGNGKVYVGVPTDAPSLDPRTQYVAILPMFSGYRDAATKQMQLTTAYWPLYDRISSGAISGPDPNDFEIIFPAAEVKSANRFDPEFYKGHFGGDIEIPASATPRSHVEGTPVEPVGARVEPAVAGGTETPTRSGDQPPKG